MKRLLLLSLLAVLLSTAPSTAAPGGTAWVPRDYSQPQLVPLTKAEKDAVWALADAKLKVRLKTCKTDRCREWAREQHRRYVNRNVQPLYWQGLESNGLVGPLVWPDSGPPLNSPYARFTPLWDACRTVITYSLAYDEAPNSDRLRSDAARAFARMSSYTGYTFSEVASEGDVRISWPRMDSGLKGEAKQIIQEDSATSYSYDVVGGTIELNPRRDLSGADTKRTVGKRLRSELIFHELAHVMGLADIADVRSVMKTLTAFSRADKLGLAAVGRGRCTEE